MTRISPLVVLAGTLLLAEAAFADAKLQKYETKYYIIHTDLDDDAVREAKLRMELMGEEYYQRTKAFSGRINKKLSFYLFRKPEDYYAAGGMPGTAGVYDGKRLMAIAGEKLTKRTWHVVQHEGFHQFVHAVIGGEIPVWVNEGLAEYFGEAVFTGDGYVSGVIPPNRLKRIQKMIADDAARSVKQMMKLQHSDWNLELSGENYDQAWSMVHFLAHAENGKYQRPFATFMKAVGRGTEYEQAWEAQFGRGTRAFEDAWKAYWTGMGENPTADRYAEATVSTLTAFLGRAVAQKQTFETPDAFFEAAKAGTLKYHKDDWLPPGLLEQSLAASLELGKWSFDPNAKRLPKLVCETKDGSHFVGSFTLKGARIDKVAVEVRPAK